MNTITEPNPTELHTAIKLGIDAHAKWFYVARQLDGSTPLPVQKMTRKVPRKNALNVESWRFLRRKFPQK